VPGNNGTVKIHDGNTENEPVISNEPQVCTFHVHFFFADAGQSGDWWIQSWPPTGNGTTVLSGSYLTGATGEYRTPASPNVYSLADGHYKLFWQGDEEELAKHKVFWVACQATPAPSESLQGKTSSPSATPTEAPSCGPIAEHYAVANVLVLVTDAVPVLVTDSPCRTNPPVTEPPVTEPPVTEPPVTEPPVTETPTESFQGATSVPSEAPTETPFESLQGATSAPTLTPPPTTTSGSAPGDGPSPLYALLVSLALGSLGFAAVTVRRRSMYR
jgi:hypothetical protein